MTSWWITWWRPQAARVDASSLRERILLFVTIAACFVMLANWAWLSPAQTAHEQLLRQLDQQTADIQKVRVDLAAMARPVAEQQIVRSELADVKTRLVALRQTLGELSSSHEPLTELMVYLLHQQDGLTLLHTATMNTSPVPASGTPASAAVLSDGLVRQGVELTVSGPYAELTRYVQALEQALPKVRWGAMWLRSEKQPPELTLQLYLVEARTP